MGFQKHLGDYYYNHFMFRFMRRKTLSILLNIYGGLNPIHIVTLKVCCGMFAKVAKETAVSKMTKACAGLVESMFRWDLFHLKVFQVPFPMEVSNIMRGLLRRVFSLYQLT